ncbi:hypothetical protein LPY66_18275 [Dehalobacter sp. DCM]|uniref:hypothetical protein n=1 Tax=Dehalobacter sp. DCM TaxID=2907827 RepID=UPI0030820C42|nr:hypothetical protein LPY66_18275 [Dehalobacter sp. DCM]
MREVLTIRQLKGMAMVYDTDTCGERQQAAKTALTLYEMLQDAKIVFDRQQTRTTAKGVMTLARGMSEQIGQLLARMEG